MHKLQNYGGVTGAGGSTGSGTIYKTDSDGNNQTVVYDFLIDSEGDYPSQLYEATNGKLYGVTRNGGLYEQGVLYEYDPNTEIYTKKHDFNNPNGSMPEDKPIEQQGNLYGVADGGTSNSGVIYKYNISTGVFSIAHNFDQITGFQPKGSLIEASNGLLYGMCRAGGTNDDGLIFEFNPITQIYSVKSHFNSNFNGKTPHGSLMEASNGKFYGMTYSGGINDKGIIFEYNLTTNLITKKFDFDGSLSGEKPRGNVIQAANGKLYGMCSSGGTNNEGCIFEYNTTTDSFALVHEFDFFNNGRFPYHSLLEASNGLLYGMTSAGGTNDYGVLFEFNTTSNSYTKKIEFNGSQNGGAPVGNLIQANNGKLYAVTAGGGIALDGSLFEYNIQTNDLTKKLDFDHASNGSTPKGKLLLASNGRIYGTTQYGGNYKAGVLFEFDPLTNSYTKKQDFDLSNNGYSPIGILVQADNGKLYGTTLSGGVNNNGTIFEYNILTDSLTKLIDFNALTSGSIPEGGLLKASNGKLYGTTTYGGTNHVGVLYEFNPNDNSFVKKVDFNLSLGQNPQGLLIEASNGKIYGTCMSDDIFEYDISTDTCLNKYSFSFGSSNYSPKGLVEGDSGKLYGTTYRRGANNKGVLYEYDINSDSYTEKLDFGAVPLNGEHPSHSLVYSSNNKIYGLTGLGGSNGNGTFFEYDPFDDSYSQKLDFNATSNGKTPNSALLKVDLNSIAVDKIASLQHIHTYPIPCIDQLNIDFDMAAIDKIKIFNLEGKLLKVLKPTNNISTKTLVSGIYIILLQGREKSYTIRFNKQ